jgi:hypothetical protein
MRGQSKAQGAGIIDGCGPDAPVETTQAGRVIAWVIGGVWGVALVIVISVEFGVTGWIVVAGILIALALVVVIGTTVSHLRTTRTRSGRADVNLRFEEAVARDGESFLEFLVELGKAHPWVEHRIHQSAWIDQRALDAEPRWYDGATASYFIEDPSDPESTHVIAVSERAPVVFWPAWQWYLVEQSEFVSSVPEEDRDKMRDTIREAFHDRLRKQLRSRPNR